MLVDKVREKPNYLTLLAGCMVQFLLLAVCVVRYSPVFEEYGRLFAGISYLQHGDTRTFNVNSPLVKSIVAAPAYYLGEVRVKRIEHDRLKRTEFGEGKQLLRQDPSKFLRGLMFGRVLMAITTVAGTVLLFFWSRKICPGSELFVICFWIFQPQVIAHGSLLTSDVACGTAMVAFLWMSYCTLNQPSFLKCVTLGVLLGVSILVKFTAIVLLPVLALAVALRMGRFSLRQLLTITLVPLTVMMFVVGVPYGFEGWGKTLASYEFISHEFVTLQSQLQAVGLDRMPVPLPEQLVLGVDLQRWTFGRGGFSFAAGIRDPIHGWWWFYLYSMLVKLPSGTLLAIFVAAVLLASNWRRYGSGLALPMSTFLLLVIATCAEDGFSHQHRYIIAGYPFLVLIVGVVGWRAWQGEKALTFKKYSIATCLCLSIAGCLAATPNWMSSFNLLAGGRESGFKCLFNDASDWGQDSYRVRDWINSHQGDLPIYVHSSSSGALQIRALGAMEFHEVMYGRVNEITEFPCWLLVSKTDWALNENLEESLTSTKSVGCLGGTHLVYRLTVPLSGD